MTDHLEPYRRLARAIRFAPPLRQTESSDELANQPNSAPPMSNYHVAKVPQASEATHTFGPPPDPSEHAAELIRAAVSKHTILPVAYNLQENIGDRISRLTEAKLPTPAPAIVLPKIPEPDPNWTPPTPPASEQAVQSAEMPLQASQTASMLETQLPAKSAEIPLELTPTTPTLETLSTQETPPSAQLPEITSEEIPTADTLETLSTQETPPSAQLPEITSEEIPTADTLETLSTQETPPSAQLPEITSEETQPPAESAQIPIEESQTIQLIETLPESTDASTLATIAEAVETPSAQPLDIDTQQSIPTVESHPTPETFVEDTTQSTVSDIAVESHPTPETAVEDTTQSTVSDIAVESHPTPETTVEDTTQSTVAEPSDIAVESHPTPETFVEDTTQSTDGIIESVTHQLKEAADALKELSHQVVASVPTPGKKSSRKQLVQEIVCPKCRSNKVKEKGYVNGQQKYVCKNCGKRWRVDLERNEDND